MTHGHRELSFILYQNIIGDCSIIEEGGFFRVFLVKGEGF